MDMDEWSLSETDHNILLRLVPHGLHTWYGDHVETRGVVFLGLTPIKNDSEQNKTKT